MNQNAVYQIYATTIAFYGPTMIMIILYVKMWLAAKRLTDQDRIAKKSINGSDRETSRNRKTHRPSTILQKIPLVILFYFFFRSLFPLIDDANSFRLLYLQWSFFLQSTTYLLEVAISSSPIDYENHICLWWKKRSTIAYWLLYPWRQMQ